MQTITVPDDFAQILDQALDAWQRELSARLDKLEEQVRKMPAPTKTSHIWTPEINHERQ